MKRYLYPQIYRRGSNILVFVDKGTSSYWIGVYYDLKSITGIKDCVYKGLGSEYSSIHKIKISKDVYDAFVAESKRNFMKYKVNQNEISKD